MARRERILTRPGYRPHAPLLLIPLVRIAGEIVQDRAVWPVVTAAALDQIRQPPPYRLQVLDLLIKLVKMLCRHRLDPGTGRLLVLPEIQQASNLID